MEIRVDNLTFSYAKREVLKGISLKQEGPGIVGLIGENGSGKSTLIRCLCGMLSSASERIFYNGFDLDSISIRKRAELFAYVPQRIMYNREMQVYDYLLFGRKPYFQWEAGDDDLEIVDCTIEDFKLESLALRKMGALSGGELQKIVIARSFIQQAPVVYLDEPTNNLDIRYQLELMQILREKTEKSGTLIVMAVHDLNLAYRYSDTLCLMHNGRIFVSGPPEDVLTEDNLLEAMGVRCTIQQGSEHSFIYPEKL